MRIVRFGGPTARWQPQITYVADMIRKWLDATAPANTT